MKRFLSLLTVFLLAFSLVVPVSAANISSNGFVVSSVIYDSDLDEYFDLIEGNIDGNNAYIFFSSDGNHRLYVTTFDLYAYPSSDGAMLFAPSAGEYVIYEYSETEGMWLFSSVKVSNGEADLIATSSMTSKLGWSMNPIYYKDGTLFYESVCDGSFCPATDENIDGTCDDCGMTLSLRSLTYPAFPSVDGANKHYALVKTKYSGVDAYMYSVFTGDVTYDIRGETPSTVYQIAVDGVADYSQYVTTDGQTWVEIQNSSVNNQSVGSGIVSQTTVIASTFDWYNEEGERFFPVPLWEEVQSMTQGEMENLTAETAGTLKVLVPCGVGLMACLVALILFGKRSLIFLR